MLDVVGESTSKISIHTPVKGVTDDAGEVSTAIAISIHTPVKGVTSIGHTMSPCG